MNTADDLANDVKYLEKRHKVPCCPECGSTDLRRYDEQGYYFDPKRGKWMPIGGLTETTVDCRNCDYSTDPDSLSTVLLSDKDIEELKR